jgi:hypothetical protein
MSQVRPQLQRHQYLRLTPPCCCGHLLLRRRWLHCPTCRLLHWHLLQLLGGCRRLQWHLLLCGALQLLLRHCSHARSPHVHVQSLAAGQMSLRLHRLRLWQLLLLRLVPLLAVGAGSW